jgi:hypothetical protein
VSVMVSFDSKNVSLRLASYKQNTNVSGSNSLLAFINQLTNSLISARPEASSS